MKDESDFRAYLKALVETPVGITFVLLDIAATLALVLMVVDDVWELLITGLFLLVVYGGNYLIFQKQRAVTAKLADRVVELEDRQPRLDLTLVNAEQAVDSLELILPERPQEPDLDGLVCREARDLEAGLQEFRAGASASAFPISIGPIRLQSPKSAEKYSAECDEYLTRYRKYVQNLCQYEFYIARLRSLCFRLGNSGRVPAKDVIVVIDFPDQLRLLPEEELARWRVFYRKRPKAPARPKSYRSFGEDLAGITSWALPDSVEVSVTRDIDLGPERVRGPFIAHHKENTEVKFEITKLIHGFEIDLGPVELIVSEHAIGHVCRLGFSIHAGNLPGSITGTLLVDIQLSEPGR